MVQGASSNAPFGAQVRAFSSDLQTLNESRPKNPSLLSKIRRAVSSCFDVFSRLRAWQIHVGAEHMALEEFSGNSLTGFSVALKETIAYLQKAGQPELARTLSYSLSVEKQTLLKLFLFPIAPLLVPFFSWKIRRDVQRLDVGQSLVTNTLTWCHAVFLEITCTGMSVGGKKEYSVTVHNTGDGLKYHRSEVQDGKIRFQTSYKLENVSEEALCSRNSNFFVKLLFAPLESPEYLYNNVLANLGGTAARIQDRRCWSHGQIAGSCSTSCVLAFLRSRMTEQQFKNFRALIRQETFLKLYREAKEGTATDHTVNVALEIARKLQHRMNCPELAEARRQLEAVQTVNSKSFLTPLRNVWNSVCRGAASHFGFSKKHNALSVIRNEERQKEPSAVAPLIQVFNGLKEEGVYTPKRHRHLMDVLVSATRPAALTPTEKARLEQLLTEAGEIFMSGRQLTKDQIYLYTALLSLIAITARNNSMELSLPFPIIFHAVRRKYLAMSHSPETVEQDPTIDALINQAILRVL